MSPRLINPQNDYSDTLLLICDIQTRFSPVIKNFEKISKIAARLILACAKCNIHSLTTEQYPKGLGKTVTLVEEAINKSEIKNKTIEKTRFSMVNDETKSQFEGFKNYKKFIMSLTLLVFASILLILLALELDD